jgi:outer membrane lipoprotein-sorting protein
MMKKGSCMNPGKLSQKISHCLFVLVILFGGIASPLLAIEPKEILRRSLEAQFGLDFEGIKKTEFRLPERSYTTTTRVIQQKPDFTYKATLAPSRFKRLIILDDGKFYMEHIRGSNKFEFFPSLNSPEAKEIKRKSLNLIFINYKISRLLDGYILGRPVYVISLFPKHPDNRRRKVWIDKKTYLPLKEEDYNSRGELISSSFFTEIHFNLRFSKEKFYGDFPRRPRKGAFSSQERFLSLKDLKGKIRFPVSFPHYLPPGYEFQEAVLLFEGRAVKLTYTNGLGVICLSQTSPNIKLRGYPKTIFKDSEGAHPLVWTKRGRTFVLRADISRKELIKIAQSVK